MTSTRGDMIVLDLTILGDPEFIKQDDILHRVSDTKGTAKQNGSLITDKGELYINLKFRMVDDPDHETGLRLTERNIPNQTYDKSAFDGIYRITTIDNSFADGSFKQVLTIIRVYNQ